MNINSRLLQDAIDALTLLPGIGKKTALRLALFLLRQPPQTTEKLTLALSRLRQEARFCRQCHNLADDELCAICQNHARDASLICVVESIREVMAIESTQQYRGTYHVLGGVISPLDGIGPEHLNIETLVQRCQNGKVREVIMALNPTLEGDTTAFYLSKRLEGMGLTLTTIARGIAVGAELEYTDDITLARSLAGRQPYQPQ
ncbi:MAG: recombination mediator RecR [Chitinophagales bacterium]|nr:recombination mediator RecR [Chitinophagales bacterium]MDW8427240.1 recombination mediator RecR [Chitinophagales bacterium]